MKAYFTPAEARSIAVAAGRDAGNRSAAKAERIAWNEDDWNVATETRQAVMAALGHREPEE